jgi:hypothetical protein
MRNALSPQNLGTAAGAAFGMMGVAALKASTSVDAAYDSIRVGTGATGDALDALKDDFSAVAGRVPDDLGVVGQVLADLNTRTGQTGEGLQQLTEQILDMSRITGTDATNNVALATRAFGDWSVAVEDQADTLDMFFRASQQTGIGVDALMQSVVQFGAPLRNIGFTLVESAAMLGKWEKEGVNTTLALGGLKIALGEFAKEGVDAKEGLADLIDQIQNATTDAEAMALGVQKFGSRAGPDMVAAIREGRFAFDDYTESIANGTETIAAATAETDDLGEALGGFFNSATIALGGFLTPLAGLSTILGPLLYSLPLLGAGLGRIGVSAALSSGGVGVLSAAVRGLGLAARMALGPIGLLLAAGEALNLGVGWLNENVIGGATGAFERLSTQIGKSATDIKDAVQGIQEETGRSAEEILLDLDNLTQAGVEWEEALRLAARGIGSMEEWDQQNEKLAEAGRAWEDYQAQIRGYSDAAAMAVAEGVEAQIDALDDLEPALREQVEALLLTAEEVPEGIAVTLENGEQVVAGSMEELAAILPDKLAAGVEAAVEVARQTPGALAGGLREDLDDYQTALDEIVEMTENSVSDAKERATIESILASKGIADGLKSESTRTRLETMDLVEDLISDYELLAPGALGAGRLVNPKLRDGIMGNIGLARQAGEAIVDAAGNPLVDLSNSSYVWGQRLSANFLAGMTSYIGAIRQTSIALGDAAAYGIRLRSPAEGGPLSEPADRWGAKLGEMFAEGMRRSIPKVLGSAMDMAGAAASLSNLVLGPQMAGSLAAGGAGGVGSATAAGTLTRGGNTYVLHVNGVQHTVGSPEEMVEKLIELGVMSEGRLS